jgi:hypothetical protein
MITQGFLEEAAHRGYVISDDAAKTLQEAQDTDADEVSSADDPVPPPPPKDDPVDTIIAAVNADAAEKFEEAEDAEEDDDPAPDFEAEAEAELLNEEISHSEYADDDEEYVHSEDRKRAIVAEKKAAYYERLTATRERKKWAAEARKQWPLAEHALGKITATSRRSYLREAKAAHDAVKPYFETYGKKLREDIEAERGTLKAEEKEKAKEAWGEPTTPPSGTPNTRDWEGEISAARRDQDLARLIGIRREQSEAEQIGGGQVG